MDYLFIIRPKYAALLAVLAVVFSCIGCDRKSAATTASVSGTNTADVAAGEQSPAEPSPLLAFKDFSQSNAVSLLLAEDEQENGLKHNYREKDGLTTIVTVADVPCRLLNFKNKGREEVYLYFAIDPAFKATALTQVRIEVEYFDAIFDDPPTWFGIHYDASGVSRSANPAYKRASQTVLLKGSNTWRTATFRIRDAGFQNAQNGRSDFRIWARPPELYVRRVTVTREKNNP